jgi:hypothetical protein
MSSGGGRGCLGRTRLRGSLGGLRGRALVAWSAGASSAGASSAGASSAGASSAGVLRQFAARAMRGSRPRRSRPSTGARGRPRASLAAFHGRARPTPRVAAAGPLRGPARASRARFLTPSPGRHGNCPGFCSVSGTSPGQFDGAGREVLRNTRGLRRKAREDGERAARGWGAGRARMGSGPREGPPRAQARAGGLTPHCPGRAEPPNAPRTTRRRTTRPRTTRERTTRRAEPQHAPRTTRPAETAYEGPPASGPRCRRNRWKSRAMESPLGRSCGRMLGSSSSAACSRRSTKACTSGSLWTASETWRS